MTLSMCPHCGYNFEVDKPLTRGRWVLMPDRAYLDGERLGLSAQLSAILYTIAKAEGICVGLDAVLNRVSNSENRNLVHVRASQLRKILGADYPLRQERGVGFAWIGS